MLGYVVSNRLYPHKDQSTVQHNRRSELGGGMRALAISVSLFLAGAGAAFAQVGGADPQGTDLAGSWVALNSVDANMDQPGSEPQLGDFMGVPVNDDARAVGEAYNPDSMGESERQCGYYPVTYALLGPLGLRITNLTEPLNGTTTAWRIGGWEDLAPITIWMGVCTLSLISMPRTSYPAPPRVNGKTTY